MKLFTYYRYAVIYPSLFAIFFSFLYSVIYNIYSGELTNYSIIATSVIPALIFCLLMCVLSLSIFLNKLRRFNKSIIYNLLTWIFLPFIYLIIVFIHDLYLRSRYNFGFGEDFLYLLIMTIPFTIGLILTFVKYRQKITIGRAK